MRIGFLNASEDVPHVRERTSSADAALRKRPGGTTRPDRLGEQVGGIHRLEPLRQTRLKFCLVVASRLRHRRGMRPNPDDQPKTPPDSPSDTPRELPPQPDPHKAPPEHPPPVKEPDGPPPVKL